MVYKEVSYSFKVWFSTVVVAPIIYFIAYKAMSGFSFDEPMGDWYLYIFFYFGIVVIGGLFSFILFAIFFLVVKVAISYSRSVSQSKSIISSGGFLLSIGTFCIPSYLMKEEFPAEILYLSACYGLIIVWFSWFYDLVETPPAKVIVNL